jgi:hypothetical protein
MTAKRAFAVCSFAAPGADASVDAQRHAGPYGRAGVAGGRAS